MSKTITHEGREYRQLPDGVAIWEGDVFHCEYYNGSKDYIVNWPRKLDCENTRGGNYYREVGKSTEEVALLGAIRDALSERNYYRDKWLATMTERGKAHAEKMIREDGE